MRNKSITLNRQVHFAFLVGIAQIASTLVLKKLDVMETHFFDAGFLVLVHNIARLFSSFCLVFSILGMGRLFLRWMPHAGDESNHNGALDSLLMHFIAGTALLSIAGAVLGTLNILRVEIVLPLAVLLSSAYFLVAVPAWPRTNYFAVLGEESRLNVSLLLLLALALGWVLLSKYIFPETNMVDSFPHYVPYLQRVIETGGTRQLYVGHDFVLFFLTRGSGLVLISTILSDANAPRFVSWLYVFGCILLLFKIFHSVTGVRRHSWGKKAGLIIPVAAGMVLLYYTRLTYFQKYHLQMMFWICALFVMTVTAYHSRNGNVRLARAIIVLLCAAMAIATPHSLYFATFIFLFYIFGGPAAERLDRLKFALFSGVITSFILIMSLMYNYFLTGLFDYVPYYFSLMYGNKDLFTNWYSFDVLCITLISTYKSVAHGSYRYIDYIPKWLPYATALVILPAIWIAFSQRKESLQAPDAGLRPVFVWFIAAVFMQVPIVLLIYVSRELYSLERFLVFNYFFCCVILIYALVSAADVIAGLSITLRRKDKGWVFRDGGILQKRLAWGFLFFAAVIASFVLIRPYQIDKKVCAAVDRNRVILDFAVGAVSYADTVPKDFHNYAFCKNIVSLLPRNAKVLQVAVARGEYCRRAPDIFMKFFPYGDRKHWGDILYEEPAIGAERLKEYGFNFFYMDLSNKRQINHTIEAFSPLFGRDSLLKHFDVYWTSDERYLLTWKKPGGRSLGPMAAARFAGQMDNIIREDSGYASAYKKYGQCRKLHKDDCIKCLSG